MKNKEIAQAIYAKVIAFGDSMRLFQGSVPKDIAIERAIDGTDLTQDEMAWIKKPANWRSIEKLVSAYF